MNKTVDYYMSPMSPWSYLGHGRLLEICALHGADIRIKPIDLGNRIFPVTGGVPLAARPPQRKAYRLVELKRWSELRDVPLNLHPKHFPKPADEAARLIIAAGLVGGDDAAIRLAGRMMAGVWRDDLDLSDTHTLRTLVHEAGLHVDDVFHRVPDAHQVYESNTQEALDRGVFGVPWYVFRDEPFWGQDRLEMLERALARG